jgi:SAM-dependent methyltransferase
VSSEPKLILSKLLAGTGFALDLGGGSGDLRSAVQGRGYRYVNVDVDSSSRGASVRGDAHHLPFAASTFDVVLSKDSLEHFVDPYLAVKEVRRVLKPQGQFIILVPFLHPFHSTDYFRFTPLGLRTVLDRGGFRVASLEAPLWVFSVIAQAVIELLRRAGLARLESPIERGAERLDHLFRRFQGKDAAFAACYLVVSFPKRDR